jgi:hypothetical protein
MRRAGGVLHQLTSHSSSNLLHNLLGQATYFALNSGYVVCGRYEGGDIRASDHVCLVAVMSYLDASVLRVTKRVWNYEQFHAQWTPLCTEYRVCIALDVSINMNDVAFSYIYLIHCWKRLVNLYLFSIVNMYSSEISCKALMSRDKMRNVDVVSSAWSVASRTLTIASKTVTRHTTLVVFDYSIG